MYSSTPLPDPTPAEPHHRHVVATAPAAKADSIVTDNDRHFARASLEKLGIEVQRLDAFLANQWSLDPGAVLEALHEIVEDHMRPRTDLGELLDRLQGRAPTFVAEIRGALGG